MMVFANAKLVFLSVPKTGTTAFMEALSPLASIILKEPPLLKHSPIFRYNRFFRAPFEKFIAEDLDVLAVMREPISWLGSWYRYRQRPFLQGKPTSTHDMSFDDFVRAYLETEQPDFANVGSQGKFFEPSNNGTGVTYLFRYEDQDSLKAFLEARLETQFTLAQRNVSPQTTTLTLMPETEARLRTEYARDFALWDGIGPDGSYPRGAVFGN